MAYISEYRIQNQHPVVTFELDQRGAVFQRYVSIKGTRLYYLGITCDTCAYLFEKRGYEYRLSPTEVSERLESGNDLLAPDLLESLGSLLESGSYGVVETSFVPRPAGPCMPDDYFANESVRFFGLDATTGLPDNPGIRYWRGGESILPDGVGAPRVRIAPVPPGSQLFFHLVAPIEPPHVLDRDRIAYYRSQLEAGQTPAAAGVSVLDVRAKAIDPGEGGDPVWLDATAWCLTTLLLDGHHKMQAAAESGRPIRLLTFLAHEPSVAEEADFEPALREVAGWA